MNKILRLALIGIAVMIVPMSVRAHGGQQSLEAIEGNYLIDIGYDQPLMVGEEILFDVLLIQNPKEDDWEIASYKTFTMSIAQDGKQVDQKIVTREDFGRTLLTYTFRKSGPHTLTARFADETPLVEHSFDIVVAPQPSMFDGAASLWIVAGICLLLVTGIAFWGGRRKVKAKESEVVVSRVT